MNKKSGWKITGSNHEIPMTKEEYKKYRDKMFKWGLFVQKMKPVKPKLTKKAKEKENEENSLS